MDWSYTAAEDAFRREARQWLRANAPTERLPVMDTAEGFVAHREWERRLFDAGWSVVSWPTEYGGRGSTLVEQLIFDEEYYAADAPHRVSQNGQSLLAPVLFSVGTPEQRSRILPGIASGDVIWAQAWSEPEAGSDLASLVSTATRVDGGYLLNGRKTWSSRGAFADAAFGLFRTGDPAGRHRGLTYLMFDLTTDGVLVSAVGRFDGAPGFAELTLEDVFVPDSNVLGPAGEGWSVAMATAAEERGLTLRMPGRFSAAADRLVESAATLDPSNSIHDAITQAWMDAEAYRIFALYTAGRMADGVELGPEASRNKIYWSELDIRLNALALEALSELGEESSARWQEDFMFALSGPIYAGTNEIQRNIVAERVLGLPRT